MNTKEQNVFMNDCNLFKFLHMKDDPKLLIIYHHNHHYDHDLFNLESDHPTNTITTNFKLATTIDVLHY